MDPAEIDYANAALNPMISSDNANLDGPSIGHQSSQAQQQLQSNDSQAHFSYQNRHRPNLVLSLNTPECNPDSTRHPFTYMSLTTPVSDFPTPSIQHALPTPTLKQLMAEAGSESHHHAHPLAVVPSESQMESIPESVENVSREFHEMQQQQQQQQQQQHHHHTSMYELQPHDDQHYYQQLDSSLTGVNSPAGSSSHASSPRSYSHDDVSNHGDFSTSPRSVSAQGSMASGRSTKSQKLTKKQQLDSMVTKKKEMELENQKLKRQADQYAIACKKLKEKLLILIQGNRGVSQML